MKEIFDIIVADHMVIEEDLSKILDNYTGRIWIVENENTHQLCDEIAEKYDEITEKMTWIKKQEEAR